MPDLVTACQCKGAGICECVPCPFDFTQEDLLCDACRAGAPLIEKAYGKPDENGTCKIARVHARDEGDPQHMLMNRHCHNLMRTEPLRNFEFIPVTTPLQRQGIWGSYSGKISYAETESGRRFKVLDELWRRYGPRGSSPPVP